MNEQTCVDETLLNGWDTLFVLNLRLDVLDGVGRLDLKSDRLATNRLDKNLHRFGITNET